MTIDKTPIMTRATALNTELLITNTTDLSNSNKQDLTKPILNDKSIKYWDKEYINNRLDNITNSKHRILFYTLWRSGMRISECINIQKKHLDFDNWLITIRWLKSRKAHYRHIPMHPDLREYLKIYTENLKSEEYIFDISRQRADQLARKYFQGSCHQFRHSFAVAWLRSGGDLFLLSKMLGHSSVKVTEIYLQVVPYDVGKELIKINFR